MSHFDAEEFLTKKVGPLPMGVWIVVAGVGLWIGKSRGKASDGAAPSSDSSNLPDDGASWTGGDPGGSQLGGGGQLVLPNDGAPITPIVGSPVPAPIRTPVPVVTAPIRLPAPIVTAPIRLPAPIVSPYIYYTIRSGDTLSAIATRYHVSGGYLTLYRLNALVLDAAARRHGHTSSLSGRYIYPGTVIKIPRYH